MGKLWIIWLANIRMVQQIHYNDIKKIYFVGFTTEYGNEYKSNLDNKNEEK